MPIAPSIPDAMKFENATITAKANVYFDGNVVSHGIVLADGSRKTLGAINAGTYHFDTQAAEIMQIIDGSCKVTLDGSSETQSISAGSSFDVPANSGFDIEVPESCQYICSYL